jgi:hypothetical protein
MDHHDHHNHAAKVPLPDTERSSEDMTVVLDATGILAKAGEQHNFCTSSRMGGGMTMYMDGQSVL